MNDNWINELNETGKNLHVASRVNVRKTVMYK